MELAEIYLSLFLSPLPFWLV